MQKNLAVILILALLAGLFSACSSQSPTPEPSAAEQTQAEQSAPTPAAEPVAAAEPEQTSEAEPAAPAPEAGPAPSQPEEAPAASAEPPAPEPDNALPEEAPEEPPAHLPEAEHLPDRAAMQEKKSTRQSHRQMRGRFWPRRSCWQPAMIMTEPLPW